MSQANVDAIQPVYEEWGKGNWAPRFEIYADDMEWGWSDEFPGLGGVTQDPELRSRRLREWLSPGRTGAARPRTTSSTATTWWS